MGTALKIVYAAIALASAVVATAAWEVPKPPGPHVGLKPDDLKAVRSYAKEDRVVGTYFFYWYDIHSGAHFKNHDGTDALVDHPKDNKDFSFLSDGWWRKEMTDVRAAGIDFILPVYWGYPGDPENWTFRGLPPMVKAWEAMEKAGKNPPRVGLFYDTSTLRANKENRHVDLSTDEGKEWFYATIRDYFSLVPPKMWAAVEGKPIVVLYAAGFAKKQDPALFPYVNARFRQDFACEPYMVREVSWQGETDAVCAWGGALGPQLYSVSSVGPGYDHHAVPNRKLLVVEREGGAFYERSWRTLLERKLARRARIVLVETWNELHEGTDVCETKEYGRKYIDLTARWAKRFKAGEVLPKTGRYGQANEVSFESGRPQESQGLALRPAADGAFDAPVVIFHKSCARTQPNPHGSIRYLYFDIDDSFLFDEEGVSVRITLEYLPFGCSAFEVHYDQIDPSRSIREGAFAPGPRFETSGKSGWQRVEFSLDGCRFSNRTNGGDFRLAVFGGDLAVSSITVAK